MSLGDAMIKTQEEEEKFLADWGLGDYVSQPCPKCNRQRLCICDNGKHRCEKCNWSPEAKSYITNQYI